ncbi:SRPBCC family protein [Pedococcus sp. P5_B7]
MKNLTTVIDIPAPREQVWATLVDTAAYPDWNPFITKLSGELAIGERLQVRIAPPGGRAMTFTPTVTQVEVGRRVEWLGTLGVRGVFDGRHTFTLESLGEQGTRLTQSEEFSGLLVPFVGRMLARTRAGFEAMNDGLRQRAVAGMAA